MNVTKIVIAAMFLSIFACKLFADVRLSTLISEFEQENDLSAKTKREGLGHVTVYTRQDIDRLQIKTLNDLMIYMPFLRYTETLDGLTDLGYMQKGRTSESLMRIYVDDQLLDFPYQGTALKYYSRINLHFVDHIDVYWGFPSFTFGTNAAATVIKIYSKNPSRENSTTIGGQVSSEGSYDFYGYSGYKYDDFSYFLSLDKGKAQRETLYHEGFALKRDQETSHLFSTFNKDKSTFTFNFLEGKYDGFVGESLYFKPIENKIKMKHFYFGWEYLEEGDFKLSFKYSHSNTKTHNEVTSPSISATLPPTALAGFIQFVPVFFPSDFPTSHIPSTLPALSKWLSGDMGSYEKDLNEDLFNVDFSKYLKFGNHSIMFGLLGQFKSYDFDRYIAAGIPVENKYFPYQESFITSMYIEDSYLFNEKNLLVSSLRFNHYDREGVKNKSSTNVRLGYIHNEEKWYNKLFLHHGTNNADGYLFANYFLANQPRKTTELIVSDEIGYHFDKGKASFVFGYAKEDEKDPDNSSTHKLASFTFSYDLATNHRLRGAYWYINSEWKNNLSQIVKAFGLSNEESRSDRHGANISLSSTFDKFIISNTFYYDGNNDFENSSYDWNLGVNYRHNRNLEFSIRGTNLLNKGRDIAYAGLDETSIVSKKPIWKEFPLNQREVWFSMEYTF